MKTKLISIVILSLVGCDSQSPAPSPASPTPTPDIRMEQARLTRPKVVKPPSGPSELIVKRGELAWNPNTEEDLAGYRVHIFRGEDDRGFIDVGNVNKAKFVVTAYNRAGQVSPESSPRVPFTIALGPNPRAVMAMWFLLPQRINKIAIGWPLSPASDNVTSYDVYRRVGPVENFIVNVPANSAKIAELAPGPHLFVIVPINASGQALRSVSLGLINP